LRITLVDSQRAARFNAQLPPGVIQAELDAANGGAVAQATGPSESG